MQIKTGEEAWEKDTVTLAIIDIGKIKTKRSAGHNELMGSLIVATAGAIVFTAAAHPGIPMLVSPETRGLMTGTFLGVPPGAAIDGITMLFKKSNPFMIKGTRHNGMYFNPIYRLYRPIYQPKKIKEWGMLRQHQVS